MHDGVDTDQPLGEQRVADVAQAPDDSLDAPRRRSTATTLPTSSLARSRSASSDPDRAGAAPVTATVRGASTTGPRAVGAPWCPRLPDGSPCSRLA